MTMAPGEGERRALSGYVPQYKVAAEKIHARLSAGDLHEIGIADPEAATLDDIQIVHHQGSALVLDAFQVKWGDPTDVVVQAEFAGLLGEMAAGRKAIIDARDRRVKQREAPVSRVICRVYTNRPPTTYSQKNDAMDGDGRSVHSFMEEVWRPAQREQKRALADVAPRWHAYCNKLASQHGMTADELLALAPDLRFEFNQVLPEDAITDDDRRSHERLKDLSEISSKLLDLVSSREDEYVWVTADALVAQHLGEEWRRRWHPLQRHEFPLRGSYEPLEKTTKKLQEALGHYDQGYVLLTGSPGSGKSTLLTHLLRTDARVAARYYAYVPESDDRLRGEASAFLHDLYLAIAGRRGRRAPVPRGGLDVLHAAFREELVALGERARELGQTQIILIDGLDHVKRSPEPHHPLLNELLPATEIPDGVLFVLGTRAVGDLPAHVSLAAGTDRHVEVEPLIRGAVLRLADKEGLADIGDKVAALSDGHPLLARTYLELVREVDAAQRARVLDELPPSLGDVWEFYRSVWETVSADPQLVSLLGMVSRIRGTIRLPWLLETGSDPADIERLRKLGYLFRRSGEDRWTFFHSSFREFLRERTAELGDGHRPELAQAHHAGLAERCRVSGPASPERFERLFHLVEAGRSETALQEATPAYFREQLDSLRPRSEVRAEIQSTARALADCHDPQGIINLALAAHELRLRGYQYPEDTDFLLLLLAVDQPELAIEHLQEIDNGSSEHDRRKSAMKLALALHRRGLEAEALRLFELHEPLEWFGARPGSLRAAIRGHRPSLRAWAEIGALLAGPGHVIEMLKALRPPSGLHPQERYSDEDVIGMRAKLLFCAGQQLLWAGRWDEADVVRAELVELGDPAAAWLTLFDLRRVGYRHRRGVGDLGERNAIDAGALSGSTLVELAELHLRDGDDEAARAVFEQIDIPALPESRHFDRRDEPPWRSFFEYHRLATRLGFVSDPVKAVPDSPKEHHDQTVLTARHVVVFAVLEGRRERSAADIEAAIKAMHSFWSKSSAHEINRRPTAARQLMTERAIVMAGRLGADALKRLFAYFEDRWSKAPVMLYRDSTDVIRAFSHAGIGKISIRAALKALEEFHSRGESSPQDWVELGRAWAGAGDVGAARRCLSRAIGRTLAITSEDDVSLSTWTRLQGPLLRGPDGDELASALMEASSRSTERASAGRPRTRRASSSDSWQSALRRPLRRWLVARSTNTYSGPMTSSKTCSRREPTGHRRTGGRR